MLTGRRLRSAGGERRGVRIGTVAACLLALAWGAAGCGASDGAARTTSTGATATGAPADAPTPASGSCRPKTDGPAADVALTVDTAVPRCLIVGPEQHLRIENRAEATTVTIAAVAATLGTGETVTLEQSFGEFLAPGVHTVHVARYGGSGPQLWLQP